MAIENTIGISEQTAVNLLEQVGSIGYWLQAVGIVLVIWIIARIISIIYERKKAKTLKEINERLERIEKKLSRK